MVNLWHEFPIKQMEVEKNEYQSAVLAQVLCYDEADKLYCLDRNINFTSSEYAYKINTN